ncbi:MAG: sigma-70 family RNA polymerase sigma factor [Capsulimonadaceae bacterium]|nr:sigma-70 family RNA polymerase sigma factor [Capsulimonadaceae bacterium]
MTLVTDKDRKAAENDSALFERLVSRHQERLYRIAYRMTGNADEAQDLLQDAVVEAYRAFSSFRQGTFFDRWLYRIMSRTFIDRQRAKKRGRAVSLDAPAFQADGDESGGGYEIADTTAEPGTLIEQGVLTESLEAAIAQLAPDFRLILILADVEELSYDEIAEILSCPVGTIKSRLHRARLQVKTKMEKAGYIGR